jgi:phage gp16-like protein
LLSFDEGRKKRKWIKRKNYKIKCFEMNNMYIYMIQKGNLTSEIISYKKTNFIS